MNTPRNFFVLFDAQKRHKEIKSNILKIQKLVMTKAKAKTILLRICNGIHRFVNFQKKITSYIPIGTL